MNALVPWKTRLSPWQEMEGLQNRIARMFGPSFPSLGMTLEEPSAWLPAVDLKELDDAYVMTAELPGMNLDDIDIDVEGEVLTLKGEKKEEKEEKDGRWHMVERSHGAFERYFILPRTVDAEMIEAEFKDGLLTLHMPKKKESKGRKIQVLKK